MLYNKSMNIFNDNQIICWVDNKETYVKTRQNKYIWERQRHSLLVIEVMNTKQTTDFIHVKKRQDLAKSNFFSCFENLKEEEKQ